MVIDLWNKGVGTAEIGRRVGRDKNAVISRVNRKLSALVTRRPSPIKRRPDAVPKVEPVALASSSHNCQFIAGENFVKDIRAGVDPHCNAPVALTGDGVPLAYCREHWKQTHVRTRDAH